MCDTTIRAWELILIKPLTKDIKKASQPVKKRLKRVVKKKPKIPLAQIPRWSKRIKNVKKK